MRKARRPAGFSFFINRFTQITLVFRWDGQGRENLSPIKFYTAEYIKNRRFLSYVNFYAQSIYS